MEVKIKLFSYHNKTLGHLQLFLGSCSVDSQEGLGLSGCSKIIKLIIMALVFEGLGLW